VLEEPAGLPSALPIASTSASRVRASARRMSPLTFEKASSMGEKFGEYAGKNNNSQPHVSTSSLTRSPLWAFRLSMTTTCPGRSAGVST
jgi:hypothetical protein